MVLLDTPVVVDALTGPKRMAPVLARAIERGELLALPALVLYEWLREPRSPTELADQEALFPSEQTIPFEPEDAKLSARLYRAVKHPRGREIDLAIAACAIHRSVPLWTTNRADFADIPGLRLYSV
jgi:predicted nucleic acid-binding protein